MFDRKHIFKPSVRGRLFVAKVAVTVVILFVGSLPAAPSPTPPSSGTKKGKLRYACDDWLRVSSDPFFIVEGRSVWGFQLGGRREDVRRLLRADVVRRTSTGEVHIFRSLPFEGAVAFRGTYIDSITVVLLKEELRADKEDVFYYSCLGFYYPDLLKAPSPNVYLKKTYSGLQSFQAGPWLFFPRIGTGFYIKNNRLSGFRIFRPVKPEAFRYWEFYSERLL